MMQYKILAAYAAGLIANPNRYYTTTEAEWARFDNHIVWINIVHADRMTLLGALRCASDSLGYTQRAYNQCYHQMLLRAYDGIVPRGTTLNTLQHKDAHRLLLQIASS